MTTVIAEGFDHYDESSPVQERSPGEIARSQMEYRLWKMALRNTHSRSAMFFAVDVFAGHKLKARLDPESELRMLHAQGLITNEVLDARLHPEKYEAQFNAEQEAAFARDQLREQEPIGANDE